MKKEVVRVNHPIVQKKIDRSLKLGLKDGGATAVASNFSISYFSPAALALGATNIQMGILYAIINLLPGVIQLRTAGFIERWSRKKLVLSSISFKIFLVLPFLLVGYLHWMGFPGMIWAFIFLVGLHYGSTAVSHPAWFSWMGSLVPDKVRGNYFSRRNRVYGFCGVLAMIVGAFILDGFKKFGAGGDVLGYTLLGFGALFALSGLSRVWSLFWLGRSYEPRIKIRKKDKISFGSFLKHCREDNFGRFALFAGTFAFAVGIATPYWSVYLLRDLGMNYIWYMGIIVSPIVFQLLFLPLFGKFSDRFGNIRLIRTGAFFASLVPLLWVLSTFVEGDLAIKIWLLLVPGVVGGFGWAGYNLALNNYVYDALDKRRTGFGLSYMNLLVGVGGFLGALLGAFLAFLNVGFMNSVLFILLVSGVVRFSAAYFLSTRLHEVRHVKRFSNQFWFREFGLADGARREIHNFEHLADKVEHFVTPRDRKRFEKNVEKN